MKRPTMSMGRALPRVLVTAGLLLPAVLLAGPPASASTVTSAVFTGGSGTVSNAGLLWAKRGTGLTLTVSTSADTRCVDVAGAVTGHQTASSGKSTWTFAVTAGSADGVQAVTATASPAVSGTACSGTSGSAQAAYGVDGTGPVITGALTPAPNAAGWNNTAVAIAWTATDAGSGVTGTQPFRTDNVSSGGTVTVSKLQDRLGNQGQDGSVTVNIDTRAPSITASQVSSGGATTVTFSCADSDSGKQTSGIATCLADGSSTNSRTVTGSATVTGTATDRAGNRTTTSVQVAGDATPPTLTGAPTTAPNGAGWYAGDVTIGWTCADNPGGAGLAPGACPASSTIGGEGSGLTATRTLTDLAGNSTTATSAPPVRIDRTEPVTGLSGTSNDWVADAVTVTLSPADNLSGVATTTYSVDGGPDRTGTQVVLDSEGDHTVTYASTDKAGNAEPARTAHVRIDRTAPAIGHHFTPLAYADGAWTNDSVTVTFDCTDQGGSGLASCTAPVTATAEGAGQQVTGRATDGAGNAATDTAVVSIDRTDPAVTARVDRAPNAAGWYDGDVTVSFPATDALSGVATVSADRVLGEGAGRSATGTATDAAGNTATASVTGIDVDGTAPVLTPSVPAGWQQGDVTVGWACTDALSGVPAEGRPGDDVVTGEGGALTSTATCTDRAGNTATRTVGGIRIDRTVPVTIAAAPDAPAGGWYRGTVPVTLTATDNLSGIAATWYALDGGSPQRYADPVAVGGDGIHTLTWWSQDGAGNLETAGAPLRIAIDGTAPATTAVNPISPATGWFVSSGVPFAFGADDAGSGVAATYYTIDGGAALTYGRPFSADLSTGTHTATYWSVDTAGNAEPAHTLTLRVDTRPPAITGTRTPGPNAAGWNNTPVDVTFSCTDADSGVDGVAGCAGDTTLANDGAGQSVHGDAVDVAGNRSGTDVGPVNVDRTRPTLTGVPAAAANGAGWYRGDVTVDWVGDDALSGIDPATQPAAATVRGEGADLGAGPVTIADRAGNVSAPASVSGIRIDRTAPVVSGAPTTAPNAAGWYAGDVVVDFSCTDGLSGVASCPTSKLVKGDGAGQSVTSDPATDVAGNSAPGRTVGGISIDGTPPSTTSNNQCTATNGYCTGSTASVVLAATDQAGLSGVREIHYRIDGGAERVAAGAGTTVSVPLDGSGAGTVAYWAVDNAGNAEPVNSVALKWDNIAPAVSHTVSPTPNAAGWNTAPVTVTFTAKDDDQGSGVAAVTAPVAVSAETAGSTVSGTARDSAGNVGTDTVTVRLDRTAPTVTGAVVSGTRGANGWYVGPVTVRFSCADALSGIAVCPDDVILTTGGASNSVTRTAVDRAGNTASATVGGIAIDQDRPALTTADVNVQGGIYQLGAVPAATCTARDAGSGVASCTVAVSGGPVGTWTWTATATDKAGNRSTATGTYRVVYRFDGFLPPITDTAHQVGTSTSVFQGGSTVPVKFTLKKADGTAVTSATAPAWLTPVKGGPTSAPVDGTAPAGTADSGSAYRADSTAGQYVYNWKTGAGGNYWRVGVGLDDGQTYSVTIGLR